MSLFLSSASATSGSRDGSLPYQAIVPTENVGGVTTGQTEAFLTITPDGAALYRVPLWVPPGRNGMEPQLALQYDSRIGYGMLGVGWTLTGLPKITRSKKNFSDDGMAGPILFDATDPFCLGTERLALVAGTHGQDGAEYRTRHESYSKITVEGGDDRGPWSFKLYQKDGRILTFLPDPTPARLHVRVLNGGSPTDVAVDHQGHLRYTWSLTRVEDRAGNTINIQYGLIVGPPGTPAGYEQAPLEIRYTGTVHTQGPRISDADAYGRRTVRFHYGTDPAQQAVRYESGMPRVRSSRLERIETWGPSPVEPALLRVYDITYRNNSVTGRSLIAAIRECDGWPTEPALPGYPAPGYPKGAAPGVCKRPLVFDWELGSTDFKDIDTGINNVRLPTLPEDRLNPPRLLVVDLDGDGRDDLVFQAAQGTSPVPDVWGPPDNLLFTLATSTPGFGKVYSAAPFVSNGPFVDPPFFMPMVLDPTSNGTNCLGYADILYKLDGTGTRLVEVADTYVENVDPDWRYDYHVPYPADINGDRLPELITFHAVFDFYRTYDWQFSLQYAWDWQERKNGSKPLNGYANIVRIGYYDANRFRIVDVDGDGAMELLVTFGSDRYAVIDDFRETQLVGRGTVIAFDSQSTNLLASTPYIFADLNGDGLPEAVSIHHDTAHPPTTGVMINTGNGFLPAVNGRLLDKPVGDLAIRTIDFDSDGTQELLIRPMIRSQLGQHEQFPLWLARWDGKGLVSTPLPIYSDALVDDFNETEIFEVLDVNGDGLDDFVMMNGGSLHLYVRQGKKPDLISRIQDSLGSSTQIDWRPISDDGVYQRTVPCQYPLEASKSSRWVVYDTISDDGCGGVNTYRHTYQDGRTDLRGQGFLGFLGHTLCHLETGVTTRETYDLTTSVAGLYPLAGQPTSIETTMPMGGLSSDVRRRKATYKTSTDRTGKVVSVFPEVIEDHEEQSLNGVSVPISDLTASQVFDSFGNLIKRVETWSDGRVDTYTAVYLGQRIGVWLIDRISSFEVVSTTPDGEEARRTMAYEYDPRGMLHREILLRYVKPLTTRSVSRVAERVTTYNRDQYGLVTSITQEDETLSPSPTRNVTYTYDTLENIFRASTTSSLGHSTRLDYHPGLGVPVMAEDENGFRRHFRYDGLGRFREQFSALGDDLAAFYMADCPAPPPMAAIAVSSCTLLIYASGPQLTTAYDGLGRPIIDRVLQRADGRAVVRETEYDSLGRIARITRPHFDGDQAQYTAYDYDLLRRPLAEHRPDGSTIRYVHSGRESTRIDALGNTRVAKFGERSQLLTIAEKTDHDIATSYEYGPFDLLEKSIDSAGNVRAMVYDNVGCLIEISGPDSVPHRLRYDGFGSLIADVAGPRTTSYSYDELGRLGQIDSTEGRTTCAWDTAPFGLGALASVSSPDGVDIDYAYDQFGRLRQRKWIIGGEEFSLGVDYDGAGRMSRLIYPTVTTSRPAFAVRYEYGGYGELRSVTDDATGYRYWQNVALDASGCFGSAETGNGVITERIENPLQPGVLLRILSSARTATTQDLHYQFDNNHNITARSDVLLGTNEAFEYDPLERLSRWTRNTPAGVHDEFFAYDDLGNIIEKKVAAGPGTSITYRYGESGAGAHAVTSTSLGSYAYDEWGNQIQGPGRDISYTSFGLPQTITLNSGTWNLKYDGHGCRIRKQGPDGEVTSIGGLYQRMPGPLHIFYVHAPTGPIAQVTYNEIEGQLAIQSLLYLYADHIGSIDTITDSSGTIVERSKYEPFGERMTPAGLGPAIGPASNTLLGFTGHEMQDTLSLIDMGGRWYDPKIGRFLTPDPKMPVSAAGQALNSYSYVLNNPLSWRDPSGFQTDDEDDEDDAPVYIPPPGGGGPSGNGSVSYSPADQGLDWTYTAPAAAPASANFDGRGGTGLSAAPVSGPLISGITQDPHFDPARAWRRYAELSTTWYGKAHGYAAFGNWVVEGWLDLGADRLLEAIGSNEFTITLMMLPGFGSLAAASLTQLRTLFTVSRYAATAIEAGEAIQPTVVLGNDLPLAESIGGKLYPRTPFADIPPIRTGQGAAKYGTDVAHKSYESMVNAGYPKVTGEFRTAQGMHGPDLVDPVNLNAVYGELKSIFTSFYSIRAQATAWERSGQVPASALARARYFFYDAKLGKVLEGIFRP